MEGEEGMGFRAENMAMIGIAGKLGHLVYGG